MKARHASQAQIKADLLYIVTPSSEMASEETSLIPKFRTIVNAEDAARKIVSSQFGERFILLA